MFRRDLLLAALLAPVSAFGAYRDRSVSPRAKARDGVQSTAKSWRGGGGRKPFILADSNRWQSAKASDFTTYVPKLVSIVSQTSWTFESGDTELPTQASVEATADTALASGAQIAVIDWETLDTSTTEDRNSSRDKMRQVLQWSKARAPSLKWGVYGECPARDYSRAILLDGHANYNAWQAENDEYNFLDEVDIVFPSIYSVSDTTNANLIVYMQENLREARRLGGNKPVYPFIWNLWHDSIATRYRNITAISTDNPAQVTLDGSINAATGEEAVLSGMTGSTELLKNQYRITKVDDTHFTLDGVNGSSITAYTSGGIFHCAVPKSLWQQVLRVCHEWADGAVIWNKSTQNWSGDTSDWWVQTKAMKLSD